MRLHETSYLPDTCDPVKTATVGYTPNSVWRNRDLFFSGTDAIVDFLTKKWEKEKNYR